MEMKKLAFLFLIPSVLFSGCSKYGSVSIQSATSPTAVLPANIHTIAVVNRSLTINKDNAIVESVLSGEVAGIDKYASDKCLNGVYDEINEWKQNSYYWNKYIDSSINIVIPSKTRLYGTGTRETPPLLDWKMVKQLCDSTKADALLVLETFDSNSDLVLNAVVKEINSVIQTGTTTTPTPPQQIKMNVFSFWRLYDPKSKKIIDQYQETNYLTFKSQGSGIPVPPPNALPETAYAAGEQYIQRFLPGFFYVTRQLYKKGKGAQKQKFEMAFRRSAVANWAGASEIWLELANNSKGENAGRACLNMAVACEVLGQYDKALMWARKSYEDYGNKLARDYANELRTFLPN